MKPATAHASALRRATLSGVLLAITLGASACGTNTTLSSLKTPAVATHAVTRDIAFQADGALAPEDAASLHAFLSSLRLGSADKVLLDDPEPHGAAARRAAVASIVLRSGGVLADGRAPAASPLPQGTARLWILRTQVTPPACPDWSSSPIGNLNASTHSNYGCAVNSNITAMVANPTDLAEGQAYAGPAGSDLHKVHDRWQRRVPTGFEKELTNINTQNALGSGSR